MPLHVHKHRLRETMLKGLMAFCVPIFFSYSLFAATYSVFSRASLMQQPSSQYFHFVRGVGAELGFFSEKLNLRGVYEERPAFRSQGFEDQETFSTLQIGQKIKAVLWGDLYVYAGITRVAGYIRCTDSCETNTAMGLTTLEERSFSMEAASFSLEHSWNYGKFHFAPGLQSTTAFSSPDQTSIKVAWPYSLIYIALGVRL